MPRVDGLGVAEQFYVVLLKPAPLAGMIYPAPSTPWGKLRTKGFTSVVCLADRLPAYDSSPLSRIFIQSLEDLANGRDPLDPDRELILISAAVEAASSCLESNGGVIVHCDGGTGRTGTVLGCLLKQAGFLSGEVLGYLDRLNTTRRTGWPESQWQSEVVQRWKGR